MEKKDGGNLHQDILEELEEGLLDLQHVLI